MYLLNVSYLNLAGLLFFSLLPFQ